MNSKNTGPILIATVNLTFAHELQVGILILIFPQFLVNANSIFVHVHCKNRLDCVNSGTLIQPVVNLWFSLPCMHQDIGEDEMEAEMGVVRYMFFYFYNNNKH